MIPDCSNAGILLDFLSNPLYSLGLVPFTRLATCRCSVLSATQRRTGGAGSSCGGWNEGGRNAREQRPQDGSLSCRLEREGCAFLPFLKHALTNFREIGVFPHVSTHFC